MTILRRALIAPKPAANPFGGNGIQFVQNASGDYDYGVQSSLPNLFGDGEFTLKVVLEPSQVTTIGPTQTGADIYTNWANETAEPGDSAEWWFDMNFLLDGHNNDNFGAGTFSLGFYNGGYGRWLFGDGSANMPTGGVWGIQNSSGRNMLDGNRHVWHVVRRWQNSPANSADLESWIDGIIQDTVNTDQRTNMATTYWDSGFPGFPVNQRNWMWGVEKQAALGLLTDYPDYKGIIREIGFYDGALSASDISDDQGVIDTGHANYLDHYAFTEGSGTFTDSEGAIRMTLTNSGNSWP